MIYYINLLYKFLNDEKTKEKYEMKLILLDNVELIDVKKPREFDPTEIITGKSDFIGNYNNKIRPWIKYYIAIDHRVLESLFSLPWCLYEVYLPGLYGTACTAGFH